MFVRANSSRFPNKCYKTIGGKNIFGHLSDSAGKSGVACRDMFLCTSRGEENEDMVRQARSLGHGVLLGPEEYPVQRITKNSQLLEPYEYIIRICGDSPLYSFKTAQACLQVYADESNDAITNTRLRNFPPGLSIEAYKTNRLLGYIDSNPGWSRCEHLSLILKDKEFNEARRVTDIRTREPLSLCDGIRYTLDHEDDMVRIEEWLLEENRTLLEEKLSHLTFI